MIPGRTGAIISLMVRRARWHGVLILLATAACGDAPTQPPPLTQPSTLTGVTGAWSVNPSSCTMQNGVTACVTLLPGPGLVITRIHLVLIQRDDSVTGTLRANEYLPIPVTGRVEQQAVTLSGVASDVRNGVRTEDRLTDWRSTVVEGHRMSCRFQVTRTMTREDGFVSVSSETFNVDLFRE